MGMGLVGTYHSTSESIAFSVLLDTLVTRSRPPRSELVGTEKSGSVASTARYLDRRQMGESLTHGGVRSQLDNL
jgi:hypothetical protein